jgi:hypothetical protein
MGQHYTLNTIETSAWCTRCGKRTPHRVSGRKLSYCIPCFQRSEEASAAEKNKPAQPEQRRLF